MSLHQRGLILSLGHELFPCFNDTLNIGSIPLHENSQFFKSAIARNCLLNTAMPLWVFFKNDNRIAKFFIHYLLGSLLK